MGAVILLCLKKIKPLFMQLDLPDVKYEYFDFHGECKNMRWDCISVLLDRMKEDLDDYGSVTSFRSSASRSHLLFAATSIWTLHPNPKDYNTESIALTAWITLTGQTLFKLLWRSIPSTHNLEIWGFSPRAMSSIVSRA